MHRLTIVSGPNRGAMYVLREGVQTLGRSPECEFAFVSKKISKRHCTFSLHQGEVVVQDLGSSNGTFLNGALIRLSKIRPGDRVGVGEYVLEYTGPSLPALRESVSDDAMAGVLPSLVSGSPGGEIDFPVAGSATGASALTDEKPTELGRKILWMVEKKIMPYFYSMNETREWKSIVIGVLLVYVVFDLILTLGPTLQEGKQAVLVEQAKRTQSLARFVADRNLQPLLQGQETQVDLGTVTAERDLKRALVVDLRSRILAPAHLAGGYMTAGVEAPIAVEAAKKFQEGREVGFFRILDDRLTVAIEPIKVFSQKDGKNIVVAMAVVSIENQGMAISGSTLGLIFSEAFIYSVLLSILAFWILYRLTLKPLESLNAELDRVLRGDSQGISRVYQNEGLTSLFDLIDSTVKRLPSQSLEATDTPGIQASEFARPLLSWAELTNVATAVCDGEGRVVELNTLFEEITGIRLGNIQGQPLADGARDQALVALIQDLFGQARLQGQSSCEDFEFSGVAYRVQSFGFGSAGRSDVLVLAAVSKELSA